MKRDSTPPFSLDELIDFQNFLLYRLREIMKKHRSAFSARVQDGEVVNDSEDRPSQHVS